jgi:excisionase family DNA binding protein
MTPRQTELAALPDLLSVAEAAQALRCSPRTVNNMVKRGELKKNSASRRYGRITKESLIVFISVHGDSVPAFDFECAVHDVKVDERYEDAPESDEAPPVTKYLTDEEKDRLAFLERCKYFDSLIPPVEQQFLIQHPNPILSDPTQSPAQSGFQELTPYKAG